MVASPSTPSSGEYVSDEQAREQEARQKLLRGYVEQIGDRLMGLSNRISDEETGAEEVINRLEEAQAELEVAKGLVDDE
jgi:hypothetical protein